MSNLQHSGPNGRRFHWVHRWCHTETVTTGAPGDYCPQIQCPLCKIPVTIKDMKLVLSN